MLGLLEPHFLVLGKVHVPSFLRLTGRLSHVLTDSGRRGSFWAYIENSPSIGAIGGVQGLSKLINKRPALGGTSIGQVQPGALQRFERHLGLELGRAGLTLENLEPRFPCLSDASCGLTPKRQNRVQLKRATYPCSCSTSCTSYRCHMGTGHFFPASLIASAHLSRLGAYPSDQAQLAPLRGTLR